MKTLPKTIWFKVVSLLIASSFLFQTNACALKYGDYSDDILPDYKWEKDAIGFGVTVAMPFVPSIGAGLGSMFQLGQMGTTILTTGIGAGLGATPGLVSGDDTAAWIGGLSGGLSAYSGVNARIEAASKASTDLYIKSVYDLPTRTRLLNELGTEGYHAFVENVSYLGEIGRLSLGEAGVILNDLNTAAISAGATELAGGIAYYSNAINPSMQQYATNLVIAIPTQQLGSTLAEVATLCWGWNPESAQFLGMLGSSTTAWTMGAMTPAGQEMMRDMYKEIHPQWSNWCNRTNPNTFDPAKAIQIGAITGLGLGAIQAGINIGLDSALDGKVPDSARFRLASLGSQALGAMAWGGIVGGLGENSAIAELRKYKTQEQAVAEAKDLTQEVYYYEPWNYDTTEQAYPDALKQVKENSIIVSPEKFKIVQKQLADYDKFGGVLIGIGNVFNDEQFCKSLIQQGMSVGISWAAEHNGMKPEYASILGSSGSMLLANLPIWPEGPKIREAEALKEEAKQLEQINNSSYILAEALLNEGRISEAQKIYKDIEWNQFQIAGKKKEAERISEWHLNSLRSATVITANKGLDMVLEPLTYGLTALVPYNLRKEEEGIKLFARDWAMMNATFLAHSGLVTVFNKQGWREFEQIYRAKNDEFYSDLLGFGTEVFGAVTSGRREEALGRSNIYGATQRNEQFWNFAGLNNFAYADRIRKQEGDWRLQMALALPSSPFAAFSDAISNLGGGLARYHTIRNIEAMPYTIAKNTVTPYTLKRVNLELYTRLKIQDPTGLVELNRWVKESTYPAYFDAEGLHFRGWIIGDDPRTGKLMLESTITKYKYFLTPEVLRELNVNRPYEFRLPGAFAPAPGLEVTPQPAVIPPANPAPDTDLTSTTKSAIWEATVKEVEQEQIPLLKKWLQIETEDTAYVEEELKRAQERLDQLRQELESTTDEQAEVDIFRPSPPIQQPGLPFIFK